MSTFPARLAKGAVLGFALVMLGAALPAVAANKATVTYNGCRADLYSATVRTVGIDVDRAYAETFRTNSTKCSLAAYASYRYFGSTKVYRTSTDWDAKFAYSYSPWDTLLVRSGHFVNYDGPLTGRWYQLD